MEELIVVDDLEVRQGGFVLQVPSWKLFAGEVVGLVGANGAGKTTFLSTLAGFVETSGGSVSVFGMDPVRFPVEVRSQMGVMSDEIPLFDVGVGALLRTVSGYYPSWNRALAESLMERFDVDPSKKTRNLSKGEGTRLRLVLAMAFEPKVLLLDEPSLGLDLRNHRAFFQTISEIVKKGDRSVVLSSHRLEDVERVADRLLVLDRGQVQVQGEVEELVGPEKTLDEAMLGWGGAS